MSDSNNVESKLKCERSKEDIEAENKELKEQVRILQSEADMLKNTIIMQTMKMLGIM